MADSFLVKKDTVCKLLTRVQQDEYEIEEFTTRYDQSFPIDACGINPVRYGNYPHLYNPDSLGVELARKGYYLFTKTDIFDKEAKHILAVHESDF